jgi:tRNA threonylcarbamoyladenosine biosynthesis protein TsaB
MLLLALDTSTRQASVALCSEDDLYGEYTWYVGNNHSVELLERISRLVAECNFTMQHLDAIAVATGPGSFNGVRVALATAKALAFALKKPLVGMSTLDVIAAQQQQWRGPLCAVLEAGRSELYAACYMFDECRSSSGEITYALRRLSEYLLLAPEQLAAHLLEQGNAWIGVPGERQVPPFLFCGEISTASRQALRTKMQDQSLFVGSVLSSRHASMLAMHALERLHEGKIENPLLLEPLYLRRPSITTSTRKQPLLGGRSTRSATTGQSQTEREEGALRR